MSRDYLLYLEDMQVSCKKLLRYAEGLDFEQFVADEKTYDAAIFNLSYWAKQPNMCLCRLGNSILMSSGERSPDSGTYQSTDILVLMKMCFGISCKRRFDISLSKLTR